MNLKGFSLKSALGALAIGAALLLGAGQMAYAQDHHQWHERQDLRDHQRRERYYYGDSWALREHQWRERHWLENHQRNERRYYDRGYYGDGYGFGRGRGYNRRYNW